MILWPAQSLIDKTSPVPTDMRRFPYLSHQLTYKVDNWGKYMKIVKLVMLATAMIYSAAIAADEVERKMAVKVVVAGDGADESSDFSWTSDNMDFDMQDLAVDETYLLSVEHASLDDTSLFDSVPAFTTRAVTTKLSLRTTSSTQDTCTPMTPSLTSQATMFYYKDLERADHFYGNVLGLEKTLDWDWVKFYKTGPASTVGLVTEGDGGWHKVQETNAVMLSLVTEEVDAWYEQISGKEGVVLLKDIADGGPIRSFLMEDPGGYTVEFFQWLELPE